MHFFGTGGQFLFGTAVHDVDLFRAQTLGAAGRVHGHVAAAHDAGHLAHLDGGVVVGEIVGLHQVGAGEELVGGVNAQQVLAGDALEVGQARAGAHEHGVEALFLEELVHGDALADDHVGDDLHAQSFHGGDFSADQILGQTEFGDAVDQHAAGGMQGLEHGDVVT